MSGASVATNAGFPTDLIESKFNELAKRTLDELKQATQRSEFFQAIDQILSEPAARRHDLQAHRKVLLQKRRAAAQESQPASRDAGQQQPQKIEVTTVTSTSNLDTEALRRQCDSLAQKQRQQQEQLDSHQQILFDSQYRSLPSEITQAIAGHEQRRAQHRAAQAGAAAAALQKSPSQTLRTQKSLEYETTSTVPRVSKPAHDSANDLKSLSPVKQQKLTTISGVSPGKTKSGGVVSSASSSSINNSASRQRSAIPQSTILSGISGAAYPLAKSATTTAATTTPNTTTTRTNNELLAKPEGGLVRQASLKIDKQTRDAQQEFIKRHTMGASLTASEKLRQRRPTKATIGGGGGHTPTSDDSDLDGNDDDDDDEDADADDDDYEYQNLASRRAYLNHRFIDQSHQEQQQQQAQKKQQQPTQVVGRTLSGATNKTTASRQSPNQHQHQQINSASQVAKQRQRFSQGGAPIVRSSTIAIGGHSQMPAVVSTSRPASGNRNNNEQHEQQQQQEPRSLGGLLTSHDIGQLYKPHMKYSTSLLGNHRLSDDDEIIIIPTGQSPSLMSASVSPDPRHHSYNQQQHQPPCGDEQPDQSTNNMDEFSERFSISRTKSFWERLANSKKSPTGSAGGGGGGENQQQYNSSVRSLTSSGHGGGPNLVAVDAKSSQGSLLMNDLKHSPASRGDQHTLARYPAAMESAFDRMDSTGGSGNSHYSGCSSTSSASDADDGATAAGYGRLQAKRTAAAGVARPKAATIGQAPAIGQLIQQDELNRSDRFRQTR